MCRLCYMNDGTLGASLAIYGYSDSARLGLAMALLLASRHPSRLKIEDLARSAESTYASAGRALRLLAVGRIVRSTRGPRGGWRLSRPANCIKLLDVLESFRCNGEPHAVERNGRFEPIHGANGPSIDWLVGKARAAAVAELAGVTLADLLGDGPPTGRPVHAEHEVQLVA